MNNRMLEDENITLLQRLSLQDWLYALILLFGSIFAYIKYAQYMDVYETCFCLVLHWLQFTWDGSGKRYLGWCWQ